MCSLQRILIGYSHEDPEETPFGVIAVPVDDFFHDYVEQLGARGLQQDVPMNGEDALLHHPSLGVLERSPADLANHNLGRQTAA